MNQHSRIRSAAVRILACAALAAVGGASAGCGESFKDPAVEVFRADVASLKSRVAALEAQAGAAANSPAARQDRAEWAPSVDGNVLVRLWTDAAEYPTGTTSIGLGTEVRNARARQASLPAPGPTPATLRIVGPGGAAVRVTSVGSPAPAGKVAIEPSSSTAWAGKATVDALAPGEYRATYTYATGSASAGDVTASTTFRVK